MKEQKLNPVYEELLKNCNAEVKRYMKAVMKDLMKDYGEIDDSWYCTLRLIRDNYQLYTECYDAIQTEGTVEEDNQGRLVKNRHLTCLWECQRTLQSLLKSFGYTPMSKTKLRAIKKETKDEKSPLDDFLNSDD